MTRAIAAITISCALVACAPDFDRAAWAAAKGSDPADNHRAEMVDDAERAGLKPGATRVFVRDLLGEPDTADSSFDFYEMGIMPYFPGQEYLIIHYDERNVVTDVRVVQDN